MTGGLAVSLLLSPLVYADFYQAPYGVGGAWRVYETTRAGTTFAAALDDAKLAMDPVTGTVAGSLVSVTSTEKGLFLYRSVGRAPGDNWIGLTDREGAAPGAQEAGNSQTSGWAWTNGDVFDFNNWGGGEPNDSTGEDAAHMRGDTLWNDHKSGFGVDEPVAPELLPGTSLDETAAPSMVYMIEYPIDSPTPLPGIRYGMVFPPYGNLNLPLNTAGNWSVRDIRNITVAGNIFDAIDQALQPAVTAVLTDGVSPYLDYTDPETNPNGGPALATTPFPYLSDTTGNDPAEGDSNVLNVATTRIKINPGKEGIYTVRVHGDDGFAMRIKGAPWATIAGDNRDGARGYIDPFDPTTIVFERGTGDANTMATINLAVGEYDVEFIHFEGGGGSFFEVSATSGDGITGGLMQWQPFGSSTDIASVNTLPAVRLTSIPDPDGNPGVTGATVRNVTTWNRGNALPAIRYMIDNSVKGLTTGEFTSLEIGELQMPISAGVAAGTDVNNYSTKVTGQITIDPDADGNSVTGELIPITFRLQSDDGSSLRIFGQDFEAVAGASAGGINTVLMDNGGDMTLTADFPTGNTDARGLVQLMEGQTYTFVSYMYEYGGGSVYRLQWELGDQVGGNLISPTILSDTGVVKLAAPAKVTNRTINYDDLPTLPSVAAVIDPVAPVIGVNAGIRAILTIPEFGLGGIPDETSMPNNNGGDNYGTKVTGAITLNADANANSVTGETIDVTFRLSCDDGANLRIVGQDFLATNGGTSILVDVAGDMVLTGDFPTGDTNAVGVIKMVEGQTYQLASYMYEFGGGSKYELYWDLGDLVATAGSPTTPLSDTATDALRLTSIPDPVGSPGVTGALVQNGKFGSRQSVLPHVRNIVNTAVEQGVTIDGTVGTVILRGDDNLTGRPGANVFASSTIMPVGINQDWFFTRVNGEFVVNDNDGTPGETLTLTFGIFADDGMELRIVGQNFNLATDYSGDGVAYLSRVGTDTVLAADYPGGNCNAFGRIDLVEGTYTFDAHQFEGGGGASMEIWYALGDKTAGFDASFRPLDNQAGLLLPANFGIPLIAGLDRDIDNDGMPTTFETANGLNDGIPADAALDNDGDGATNVQEYAAGTLPNNPASVLRISAVAAAGGGLQVTAPTKLGHHYRLMGSPDLLQPWTEFGRALPTADGLTTWTIPTPAVNAPTRFFFRVEVEIID